jgi:HK97 gp10 family phage protein
MNIVCEIKTDFKILNNALLEDYNGSRKAGMINLMASVEALAVKKAPKKTSNLARSRTSSVSEDGYSGTISFTAPYAAYVHDGTGIFGIHHTPIVPTKKKALYWPGAKHPMRSVKGMKGNPFVTDAVNEINVTETFNEGMRNYLSRRRG